MLKKILCLSAIFLPFIGTARDIDLDSIYISEESQAYKRLISQKTDAYAKAASKKVHDGVIFARWISGTDIVYIREFQYINIVYLYNQAKSSRKELLRISGTVTSVVPDPENRYLYVKYLTIEEDPDLENHFMTIDLITGKTRNRLANNLFLDFSVPAQGSSIIFESRQGISEEFTETGLARLLIPVSDYSSIIHDHNPTIALFSPNRSRCLLLNGSGGNYKTVLFGGGRTPSDISSLQEIFWLGNDSLIYRSGYTGSYDIALASVTEESRQMLIQNSLNTNLCVSPRAGKASFLYNQMIIIYNFNEKSLIHTGLEGEDVYFSPDGALFLSLFHKDLFITRERTMLDKKSAITANGTSILRIYEQSVNDEQILLNEYSKNYCQKKIQAYSSFLGIKSN